MAEYDLRKLYTNFPVKSYYEDYSISLIYRNEFFLNNFHAFFAKGHTEGKNCLDLGSGANINAVISASKYYKRIILSDFSEVQIQQLNLWLENDPKAFDWTALIKYCAQLEGDLEIGVKEIERRLRERIQDIWYCDVTKTQPLLGNSELFDVVTSCFCLQAAAINEQAYTEVVGNISSLLNPGGRLVTCGSVWQNFYIVNEIRFPCMNLNEGLIKKLFHGAGLHVDFYEESAYQKPDNNRFDGTHLYFCVARKPVK